MISKGINLLVDKRKINKSSFKPDRLGMFRLVSIIILFGTGFVSIILSILIVLSPLPQLQDEERKAKKNLASYIVDINKLAFVNERGDSIRKLLKDQKFYDKKIEVIQSKLPPGVFFDSFVIDKKRYTYTFSGDNLASINELLDSLTTLAGKGREYSRIFLTSLSNDENKGRFVMVVDLI